MNRVKLFYVFRRNLDGIRFSGHWGVSIVEIMYLVTCNNIIHQRYVKSILSIYRAFIYLPIYEIVFRFETKTKENGKQFDDSDDPPKN